MHPNWLWLSSWTKALNFKSRRVSPNWSLLDLRCQLSFRISFDSSAGRPPALRAHPQDLTSPERLLHLQLHRMRPSKNLGDTDRYNKDIKEKCIHSTSICQIDRSSKIPSAVSGPYRCRIVVGSSFCQVDRSNARHTQHSEYTYKAKTWVWAILGTPSLFYQLACL